MLIQPVAASLSPFQELLLLIFFLQIYMDQVHYLLHLLVIIETLQKSINNLNKYCYRGLLLLKIKSFNLMVQYANALLCEI